MATAAAKAAPAIETARALSATVQEKMKTTRRALKQLREDALDAYDNAIHEVKRHPGKALAITAGAGACVGLGVGLLIGRAVFHQRRSFFGL